jgi:hypothetical protein
VIASALKLMNRKLEITAAGLFEIKYSLLYSVSARSSLTERAVSDLDFSDQLRHFLVFVHIAPTRSRIKAFGLEQDIFNNLEILRFDTRIETINA